MSKKPYYTSNALIEAVKRNISFPISQVTFSEEDILTFADEEMFLEQVPSILQFHEESVQPGASGILYPFETVPVHQDSVPTETSFQPSTLPESQPLVHSKPSQCPLALSLLAL